MKAVCAVLLVWWVLLVVERAVYLYKIAVILECDKEEIGIIFVKEVVKGIKAVIGEVVCIVDLICYAVEEGFCIIG